MVKGYEVNSNIQYESVKLRFEEAIMVEVKKETLNQNKKNHQRVIGMKRRKNQILEIEVVIGISLKRMRNTSDEVLDELE